MAVNNSQQVPLPLPLPLPLKTLAGQGKVKDGGDAEATFSFDYMVARLDLPLLCWPRPQRPHLVEALEVRVSASECE